MTWAVIIVLCLILLVDWFVYAEHMTSNCSAYYEERDRHGNCICKYGKDRHGNCYTSPQGSPITGGMFF